MQRMYVMTGALGVVIAGLLGTGCASLDSRVLRNATSPAELEGKAIALFSIRTENIYKPDHQPGVKAVSIVDAETAAKKPILIPDDARRVGSGLEFLCCAELSPGMYTINKVSGLSGTSPLSAVTPLQGGFNFPVNARFRLENNSLTYIGRLQMVNRERRDGEPRSGNVLPLIDQAVAGFSGGTFDVSVFDNRKADIPRFVAAYPVLRGCNIEVAMMAISATNTVAETAP